MTTVLLIALVLVVAGEANAGPQAFDAVREPQQPTQAEGPSRTGAPAGRHVAAQGDLDRLYLLQSITGHAVVRFGSGPLEVVTVADRLGKNKAEVQEITSGRMVLEESFIGQDGRPNRARIVIKDGETGGKRYLLRNDEPPVRAVTPRIVVPKREPEGKPPDTRKPAETKKPPGAAR